MRNTCETCVFWHEVMYECHRKPPVVMFFPGYKEDIDSLWPETLPNDWCGEYEFNYEKSIPNNSANSE